MLQLFASGTGFGSRIEFEIGIRSAYLNPLMPINEDNNCNNFKKILYFTISQILFVLEG